jgi:hypothetical protein
VSARGRGEEGVAIVTVLLAIVVVSMLVFTSLQYASASQGQSRRNQDFHAALPAAEAGIDDYLTRLNKNDLYAATFSSANPDPANPAFSGFVPVAGGEGQFRYTVDTSTLNHDGLIEVTATGRWRGVERTVRASLRRAGFLDFLYFTDYETRDPAQYTKAVRDHLVANDKPLDYCARHFYDPARDHLFCDATSPVNMRGNLAMVFANGDVIHGPLHSNDAMRMDAQGTGPRFAGATSTTFGTGARWLRPDGTQPPASGGNRPLFSRDGDPAHVGTQMLPAHNEKLRADAIAGGCLFTGPTEVFLLGNGQMQVRSPFTKDTNPGRTTKCTTADLSTLQTINLPANGVLFVQNVPTSGVNAGTCANNGSNSHPLGYPKGSGATRDVTPYGCVDGDLFIEGTLKGQLTASAENNIVITWDLQYAGGLTGTDVLGLIAVNDVLVHHPVDKDGNNLNVRSGGCGSRCTFSNPKIQAAILSLQHTFTVQNFRSGASLGTLRIDGSIAQKFRGPVATNNASGVVSGYLKDYVYDNRLQFISPPRFLQPIDAPWGVVRWEER